MRYGLMPVKVQMQNYLEAAWYKTLTPEDKNLPWEVVKVKELNIHVNL